MACAICGGERFESAAVAGVTIRRCTGCGLRTSAITSDRRINYADVDEGAYLESIGRVRRAQAERIVRFVRAHGGSGEWLDVGCGYGYVLDAARAAGFTVRGIEPDAKAAQAARERIGNVTQGTLDDSIAGADVLSSLDVLEHLHDVNAFAALVKSKARLWAIKVPSSEGLFFKVAHALRLGGAVRRLWQSEYEHPHTVYFDRATLTRFLERNGFEVVAARYLDEVPNGTVVDRLTLDGRMPRWKAMLAVPLFFVINLLERVRGKSDALLVLAKPGSPSPRLRGEGGPERSEGPDEGAGVERGASPHPALRATLSPRAGRGATPNVLFVLAHQDDEIAFVSRIRFERARGNHVICVCLTDGAVKVAPSVRDEESRRVLARLGVDDFRVAPPEERIRDGQLPERLEDALAFLEKVEEVGEVVTLAWEGGHHDHDAANLVAGVFARNRGVPCLEMPLYTGLGVADPFFRVNHPVGDGWLERPLPRREYLANVLLARFYKSQRKTWLGLLPLLLIGRPRELIRPADLRRAYAPPHERPLLYERRFHYPYDRFAARALEFLRKRSGPC